MDDSNNIVSEQQLNFIIRQAEDREDALLEMLDMKRDMKRHVICIRELIAQNDNEKAIAYADHLLTTKLGEKEPISKSGNVIIDSLINSKYKRLKQLKIGIKADLSVPIKLPYDDEDLLVILENAMTQAETVVQGVKEKERCIYLSIEATYNALSIIVRYPCLKSNANCDSGMEISRKVVEKYNGNIETEYCGGEFTLSLFLRRKQK